MKYFMHLFVLMLFICVHPVTDAFAQRGGIENVGDLAVYAGELEMKKGNIDGAIHEFSIALMAQPNNKKAAHYLRELGYSEGLYTSQSKYMPQTSQAMSRMEIMAAQMDRVEAQHQGVQARMAKAQSKGCVDYFDAVDQRAGIITLCDGTKKFIKSPSQIREDYVQHLYEEPEPRQKVKNSTKGSYKESYKGSGTVYPNNVKTPSVEKTANPQTAHLDTVVPEATHPMQPENPDTTDERLMAKIRDSYHLEQQYDYAEFLRNQYFLSQEEVLNRSDLIDEQHLYLVKLHWELEESRNQIEHLLKQQENLLNHTTFEVHQMQENGRIE